MTSPALWRSEANGPCWNRAVCSSTAHKTHTHTHTHAICVKGDKRALTDALVCVDRPMTRERKRVFTQQPVCVCRACTHTHTQAHTHTHTHTHAQSCVSFDVWTPFSAVLPLKLSSVLHTLALCFSSFWRTVRGGGARGVRWSSPLIGCCSSNCWVSAGMLLQSSGGTLMSVCVSWGCVWDDN